jgi:hypothetical protein
MEFQHVIQISPPNFIFYFFFLFIRNSLQASITVAVNVVSLSKAYCFNCLMMLFGILQVVFISGPSLAVTVIL